MKEIIMICACDCREYEGGCGLGNKNPKVPNRTCPDCGAKWREVSRRTVEVRDG